MRGYPLLTMWPCDRPLVNVLNGDYPAADLRRMSLPGLERLVSKLVQHTARPCVKPQWWPNELIFTDPLDLGLSNEREIKLAFKQLIVSCCQFFKANEKRKRKSAKHRFLHYFRLHGSQVKREAVTEAVPPPPKLTTCVNIPFSSDVGRILAAREQHGISEEVKLRRLERSEWYTNKGAPRTAETEFEVSVWREPSHSHVYKMPKRQQYQKRQSLHDVKFLARFCTPVSVVVERLDLNKVVNYKGDKRRELVVMIKDTEKMCCDIRISEKFVRTSPEFRNV